jgi:tetratricopeptide (TPR) repeat protein
MKRILVAFLIVTLFYPLSAFGEIQIITHAVKQPFGGSQSPDDARIAAVAKAKREALELAGTYVESTTVVKNAQVEKDEILALAAGVLKAEVVSQKNYASEDAFGIDVVVKVVVDTSVLEERVKKLLQDKTHLTQLIDAQKKEKELLQKVAQLEQENRKLTANKQSTQKLKKEFQQASQGLTAVEWFYKAHALWDGGKYTDPKKVVEYLNNAIKLQPKDADAYGNRGTAYAELGQYQHAIEDYNEVIRLKPDYAIAYGNRGTAYADLGQHQRAIEDYNKAIRLQPNDAYTFNNRGIAYRNLGQYQHAIEDYNEVIRLKPDYADAYIGRGLVYGNLGQYQRAIEDYNKAINLQPALAIAYNNRGNGYGKLGEYQRAIEDFNKAISLQPNDADAYNNRGIAYSKQGNNELSCRDAQKACALGNCKLLDFAKVTGYCR